MKKFITLLMLVLATTANAQQQVQEGLKTLLTQRTPRPTQVWNDSTLDRDLRMLHTPATLTKTSTRLKASSDYTVEVVNEYGLIMAPAAGEERIYSRSGMQLLYNYTTEESVPVSQEGGLVLVETTDGTVYMKQPVSCYGMSYAGDSWIKGHRDGKRIVFPGNQKINYVSMFGESTTLSVCHAVKSATAWKGYASKRDQDIVFTESLDGSQLMLDGTDEDNILAVFWDDTDEFTGYGDYETILISDSRAFEEDLVTPPDGLETVGYILEGTDYKNGEKIEFDAFLGFDGDVAYLSGFCSAKPDAWIQGRREGQRIIFPACQYIGKDAGFDLYVYGGTISNGGAAVSDFYLTYSESKKAYTASTGLLVTRGKITSTVVLAQYLTAVRLYQPGQGEASKVEIMYDRPEGTLKTYARLGGSYYTFFGYILDGRQEGKHIDIVTAPDGKTIYMMNPISQGATEPGAWIKGTIGSDDKIHMPLGQYTYQDPENGTAMQTAMLRLTVSGAIGSPTLDFVIDESFKEAVFDIAEDGTLVLEPAITETIYEGYPSYCYGLVYNDDLTWTGYGDYDTRYLPFADVITTIPATAATQRWSYFYSDGTNNQATEVNVGIEGNKMYLAGLNTNEPKAAIVGTISQGKVEFPSDQYIGNSAYDIFLYFVGATYITHQGYDEEFDYEYSYQEYQYQPSLTLNYDATAKTLSSTGDVAIVVNQGIGATNVFTPSAVGLKPRFSAFEEKAATPASPAVVEYSFYFDEYGYDVAEFSIPTVDTNGNYIATDKLFYIAYVSTDGQTQPITLTTDVYEGLASEVTEIPYNLTVTNSEGWSSIVTGGKRFMLFSTGYDDLGVQSIYYGGGERHASPIVWWSECQEGITKAPTLPRSQATYDLSGRQVQTPARGLYIRNGKATIIN